MKVSPLHVLQLSRRGGIEGISCVCVKSQTIKRPLTHAIHLYSFKIVDFFILEMSSLREHTIMHGSERKRNASIEVRTYKNQFWQMLSEKELISAILE